LRSSTNDQPLTYSIVRGVAQSGSAPGSGPGGRRFESSRPDHFKPLAGLFKSINYNFKRPLKQKRLIVEIWDHWDHRPIFPASLVAETGRLETQSAV
jgi:hypothetical protein